MAAPSNQSARKRAPRKSVQSERSIQTVQQLKEMAMFDLRTIPRVAPMALIGLVVAFSALASTPAHAAKGDSWNKKGASMKSVLAACGNTAGCTWDVGAGGDITGCTTKSCFSCNGKTGTCNPAITKGPRGTMRPGNGTTVGNASASRVAPNNENKKPIENVGTDKMKTSGKH